MKRARINKLITTVTILTLALTLILSSASLIFAESGSDISFPEMITTMYYPKVQSNINSANCFPIASTGDARINWEKTTVADPSIVELKEQGRLYMIVKKPGATTITLVATPKGSDKEQTFNIKFNSVKYVNALKTIKIGKKNYVKKLNKVDSYLKKTSKLSGKLVVKAKKGWKITKIEKCWMYSSSYKMEKIKNGKKVTLDGKVPQSVVVTIQNKKTGQVFYEMVGADKFGIYAK